LRVLRWAAGLLLSAGLLCGCSQQAAATDDLIQSLTETHSAIASSLLGIELYEQDRSTRAVTETLLGDMAKQVSDAQSSLEPVTVSSEQVESERDATLAAVHASAAALLTSRDQLEQHGAVANKAYLEAAGHQVDALLDELRSKQ
jgi:hypothetical protein